MIYIQLAIAVPVFGPVPVFLIALFFLFLNSWILLPAPTMALLPLGVGVPEMSPLFLLINSILLVGAIATYQPTLACYTLLSCLSLSLVLSSLPLLQLPSTLEQAHHQMEIALTALGQKSVAQISHKQQRLRSHPIILRDFIRGITVPTVERDLHSILTPDGTALPLNIYYPPFSPHSSFLNPQVSNLNPQVSNSNPQVLNALPLIITIYGGGWRKGHPDETADFSRYMAAQGYVVAAIAYRHTPTYVFPTQLKDVQTALHWITQHRQEYSIDLTRVALVGWSAGAHLALLTAYQSHHWPPGLNIRAVVNYYGPVDLVEGYRDLPHPDPINVQAVLTAFLGGSPAELPNRYREASPLYQIQTGLPPTLSIYGDRDHIVKPIFGQRLNQQLRQTDNTSILIRLPWAEHAFDKIFRGLGNQISLHYIERFLASFLFD